MTDGTIDHIGIATTSLDESQQLWTILGFTQGDEQINSEQGVKIRFMRGNASGWERNFYHEIQALFG